MLNWQRVLINLVLRLVVRRPNKPGDTVSDLRKKLGPLNKPFEAPANRQYL
jgi:hypothetical protein